MAIPIISIIGHGRSSDSLFSLFSCESLDRQYNGSLSRLRLSAQPEYRCYEQLGRDLTTVDLADMHFARLVCLLSCINGGVKVNLLYSTSATQEHDLRLQIQPKHKFVHYVKSPFKPFSFLFPIFGRKYPPDISEPISLSVSRND